MSWETTSMLINLSRVKIENCSASLNHGKSAAVLIDIVTSDCNMSYKVACL